MRAALTLFAVAALVSGCCEDAEACPQNTVAVHVTADAAPVEGVTVEGGGATWDCLTLETETLCAPQSIADGAYELTVTAPGRPSRELELDVRTYAIPPFSCDCEIPTGSAAIEYAPASPADGGV